MIGLPNPYVILGGVGLFLAATGGAFFEGKHVAKGEYAQAQVRMQAAALADRDQKQKTIDVLETAAAAKDQQRQTTIRETTREIPTIVRDPVYLHTCVTDAGVRALDRVAAAANGDSPGPAAGGPAQAPAHAPNTKRGGQAQH